MAGWAVSVGSPDPDSFAAWSRTTFAWDPIPGVGQGVDAFVDATAAAVARRGSDVVFPAGDAEALGLVSGRERIGAVLPYGDYADVRRAFDKLDLTRAAQRVGLGAPATEPATPEALATVSLPVVVKSRLHWSPEAAGASARIEAGRCGTRAEAVALAEAVRAAGGEPLLQEVVPGVAMNLPCLTDRDGRLIASVRQMGTDRFFPPGAGRRTRSCSLPADHELDRLAEAFLRELGWVGFTGLSFLLADDGTPQLVDFNGRLPMSLDASIVAGVNFVALWGAIALGQEVDPHPAPRAGARWHWLEGDLKRALRERRGGLARDLAETLRYSLGARHTVIRLRDPVPLVRHVVRLARRRRRIIGAKLAARRQR